MVVIINELSLNGQFENVLDFAKQIQEGLYVLEILSKLEIQIFKNNMFFESKVTATETLHNVLTKHTNDEIRVLRKQIYNFCIEPPYWEHDAKHSCDNEYKCKFTTALCQYGLAEAVENNKVVFSFCHTSFLDKTLSIFKDRNEVSLINLTTMPVLRNWLTKCFSEKILVLERKDSRLPHHTITDKIIEYSKYDTLLEGKQQEEKIVIYEEFGELVALMNGWDKSKQLSAKNNRLSFEKTIGSTNYIFTIDMQHGTFELHDQRDHIAEYNFLGEPTSDAVKNRKLN
jgi:hypothetical protein